jgi:hypothetical protein
MFAFKLLALAALASAVVAYGEREYLPTIACDSN